MPENSLSFQSYAKDKRPVTTLTLRRRHAAHYLTHCAAIASASYREIRFAHMGACIYARRPPAFMPACMANKHRRPPCCAIAGAASARGHQRIKRSLPWQKLNSLAIDYAVLSAVYQPACTAPCQHRNQYCCVSGSLPLKANLEQWQQRTGYEVW